MTVKSCIPFCRIFSNLIELYPEFNLIASIFLEKRQIITKNNKNPHKNRGAWSKNGYWNLQEKRIYYISFGKRTGCNLRCSRFV